MTSPASPRTVWERSDGLQSGAAVAIRGIAVPSEDIDRSAVAVTVRVRAGQFHVSEADGTVTATLLASPGEALGMSAWLRDAALAADPVGPPLHDWDPS